MMLKKLWKKSTPLFLALVLVFGALCAAIPAGTAHAAGLTLTANPTPSEMIAAGTVTITGTIKNDTGEEISGVSLWDVTTGTASEFSGAGASTMGPGDAYNYSVTVQLSDARHLNTSQGNWRVVLQARGKSASGGELTSDNTAVTVTKTEAKSAMNLTLSASNGGTPVPANQVVTFTLLIENTGNTALSDISVTDPTLGTIASGVSLGVGESKTVTAQHTMLQSISVRATATGKSVIGGVAGMQISSVSNEVTVTMAEAGLTVSITPDTLEVSRGDKVNFKGTLTNTGNMDISSIAVTDVYGVEALKDLSLKAGESKEFTYETTIENSDPYKVYVKGVGSDNQEITTEYELKFNVKLSEDDVRVDMTVKADYPELEEPDTVIFTFEFYNDRTEPINLPMIVRQVDGDTLFSLVVLSPGTTTQDYEMRIDESCTLRFELVATTEDGEELIAGAAACSITVADQPEASQTNKPTKGGNLTWLWILLGVVGFLLVAAGVVFFVLVSQEKKNKARRAENGGDGDYGYGDDGYDPNDPNAPGESYYDPDGYDNAGYDNTGYDASGYGYGAQQGGYESQNTASYDMNSSGGASGGDQNFYGYDAGAYTGSYRAGSYSTGSQFADSLFNDSQIGAVTRNAGQLTDGTTQPIDVQDDAFAQPDPYASQSFGSDTVFGYSGQDQNSYGYGTTQTTYGQNAPADAPQTDADDDVFADLLGDDGSWSNDGR